MGIKIALAGNPNCGKTTLFNELTGSTQYVGNWPGVTVEKKEGRYKKNKEIIIQDLPGIYSLSPYTQEEVVSRKYLVNDKPDVILNIVDSTNIERNLYLTTQLLEVGIPVVIALNMIDIVRKNNDKIDVEKISKTFNCKVIEISAIKREGIDEAINICISVAKENKKEKSVEFFTNNVLKAINQIEDLIKEKTEKNLTRWYAVKIFEKDEEAYKELRLNEDVLNKAKEIIEKCEKENDDISESIITDERYKFISNLTKEAVKKGNKKQDITISDKIDRILTHRIFALPLFAVIMFIVYSVSMGELGTFLTDWANEGLFGESWEFFGIVIPGIPTIVEGFLTNINASNFVVSLVLDGIIAGVGTVLGFVPQMAILFLFLALLEDSGYMARVAFIFDRVFRKFGLSGKSFIPMLIGTGCGVPAIMAARTIEEERDRRMTIMLSTFIPCAAKMEIVLLITSIFFRGNSLVATSMYFIGIIIVILSGIALKKLNYFSGDPAPFVMELPAYHFPTVKGVLIHVWERVKAYMIKAGTIIFIACVVLWFLMNFNFSLEMVEVSESILKTIGEKISFIFLPLGFGNWQGVVATVSAELAKEQATATLGMLANAASEEEADLIPAIQTFFNNNSLAGLSFMLFNIFNAPCLVAIATAFREQGNAKWGFITFIFQMLVGYVLALIVFQIGSLITNTPFGVGAINCVPVAIILVVFILVMVLRPNPYLKK